MVSSIALLPIDPEHSKSMTIAIRKFRLICNVFIKYEVKIDALNILRNSVTEQPFADVLENRGS